MFLRPSTWYFPLLVLLSGLAAQAAPPEGTVLPEPGPVISTTDTPRTSAAAPEKLPEPRKLPAPGADAPGEPGGRQPPESASDSSGPEIPVCPPTPIDLAAALKLANLEDPAILIARQRVVVAVAEAQLAAAQLLPSANLGMNYDAHAGPLQQSNGNILRVDRSALYVGAGANAVAAGTVNIPGLVYNLNISQTIFDCLIAKQEVERREFAATAVANEMFRQVAVAYAELLRAVGRRSIAQQMYDEASEVARTTAAFVKAGQTAAADGDRTANEQQRRRTDLIEARAEVVIASARLAELLAIDQSVCLHPIEDKVVPMPIVPDSIPLCQLLAIAIMQRPELAEWQVAIRQALTALCEAKVLPFSPNMIMGLSGGDFGGGSSIVGLAGQPIFGNVGLRNDYDAVFYWTLRNMGIGNLAMIKVAAARVGIAELEKLRVFNLVRRQVAEAAVSVHARFRQITTTENAVRVGTDAFKEDFARIRGGQGRPIELLESLRLLGQARNAYLNAIVDYNEAQIDLFVALGKPPADVLARPVPTNFAAPVPRTRDKEGEGAR